MIIAIDKPSGKKIEDMKLFDYSEQGKNPIGCGDLEKYDGFVLNLQGIKKAINSEKLRKEFDWHFKDIINDNDDATTSDVFFQISIFGDVIFG